ncbi:MAG: response regulator [Methanomicrobiales archaeon]|nr:response regulator [Methanomicrobiales archaeon]
MTDTVLLVDDDPAIRELFTIYLARGGFRPLAVAGGAACLEFLRTETPDLLVLDLMMEPMDGWETLEAITTNPAGAGIPVVIITGKQPVAADILRFGPLIWDYRLKPVDMEQVVKSFGPVIERDRSLRRQLQEAITRGADPELAGEYSRLLHLVRVAKKLELRRRKSSWTEPVPVDRQETRLHDLHAQLGLSGTPLEDVHAP